MRTFFKIIVSGLFILLVPIVLAMAMPWLNGYSTNSLKQYWRDHHFYDQLSQTAQSELGAPNSTSQSSAEDQLFTLIKGELTPTYIQTKVETTVNQTRDWAIGKTSTPPSISFNDLQDKLTQESPVTKQQLDQILAELKNAEAQGNQLPQVSNDAQSQQAFQQLLDSSKNMDAIANGNWTFSLAQPLAGLPFAYRVYSIALPTLAALAALCLVGVLVLATNARSRLSSSGWTLTLTGIWNAILASVFYGLFIGPILLRTIPHSGATGEILTTAVQSLQQVLFSRFVPIEAIATAGMVVAGLGLIILAKRQPGMVATASSSTAGQVLPGESFVPHSEAAAVPFDSPLKK